METINILLAAIVAVLGLPGGILLTKIAKEELLHGKVYFLWLQSIILIAAIALSFYSYMSSPYIFALVIALVSSLIVNFWPKSVIGYIILAVLFALNIKNESILAALFSLTFLYGLPTAALMKIPEKKESRLLRYDIHTHTTYSSCSTLKPKRLLERAIKKGLDGIAVTDHNTIKGAFEVKKLNKNKKFEVIIGEEISTDKGDLIALYLKKPIRPGKFEHVIKQAKSQNAIVMIPHPYDSKLIRKRFSMDISKIKNKINALETINGRCIFGYSNHKAQKKADLLALASLAGSDAHFAFELGSIYTEFKGSLSSAVKNRKTSAKGIVQMAVFARILSGIVMVFKSRAKSMQIPKKLDFHRNQKSTKVF